MKRLGTGLITMSAALAALLGATLVPASAEALGQYEPGTSGIDISYPSCNLGHRIDLTQYPFVVAGVSGGSTYTDNKCAKLEASYSKNSSLYVNTGLYTGGTYFQQARSGSPCNGDSFCGAYQYGYRAGKHAYDYAVSQGLGTSATTWWLDVEETNTWNGTTAQNVQSIQGEYDALAARVATGSTIGIYAVRSQWDKIVGSDWPAGHDYPVWAADGLRTEADAEALCVKDGAGVTGGPVYMAQYVVDYGTKTSLDHDYVC